ncbi:MAG: IS30 family transposase [Candidatus Moranbacteria bacterium]|nr:IS30 family transposase [Candidatus Moranbacteria bacterium]
MDMPKGKEITLYERERIEVYLRMKKKKSWIAKKLGRNYSIIKREIKRNSGQVLPYVAKDAQYYAERRRKKTNKRKLEKWQNEKLAEYVKRQIREGWSPEEVAGRLKNHPPQEVRKCKDRSVSYESIYNWIYEGEGRFEGLYKKLRRKQKVRKRRFARKKQIKTTIKERVSVSERPAVVGKRERVGDWETDSVIFSGRSILSVRQERKTKLCRLHKCEDKTAVRSEEALRDIIESLPRNFWLTITRDNGSENVLHHGTEVPSFFCDTYCSWQKGGVENLNGLIREYFPKKSDLDKVEGSYVYTIQEKLNNRARKSLNYLTPNEVLALEIEKGALNS